MRKPRRTFAAPFVLVIGCGQPQDHVSRPHHTRIAADAAESLDASIDAPIDAAIETAEVSIEEQCAKPWKYHVYCNPPQPPPKPPLVPPTTANPPAPSRILAVSVQGADVLITVGVGTDQGLTKDWKAALVRDDGRVAPGGNGMIVRVDKTRSMIKVRVPYEMLEKLRVRFSPP